MSFLHDAGDLAQTPLAAILLEALNLRASGVLTIQCEGGSFRLFLKAGVPVGAQVFAGFKPLGQVLLAQGLIDIQALTQSLSDMARTGKQQGELLVEMGAIDRPTLERILAEQQRGYVSQIASLEKGAFQFDPGAAIPEWTQGIRVSPLRAILDALEKPQSGMLVASAFQQVAGAPITIPGSTATVAEAFGLDTEETSFAARLQRPNRIENLLDGAPVAPERARAMLAAFLLLGLAEQSTTGFETPPPRPSIVLDLEQLGGEPLAEHARALAGPAAVDAPPGPAASPEAAPTEPAPPRRSDPVAARQRRQRLLARAMQNMGIGPFGGQSPGARPAPPASAPAAPAQPGAAAPAQPAPAEPGPAAEPTSAEASLRRALQAAVPRIAEPNYFARLGLPPTAGRDQVKQAYFQLAKQLHPDRFISPGLADLAPVVKDLFAALNEAYETLGDDKRRAEYLARLAIKKPAGEAGAGALVDFKKGESLLRSHDFARARGFIEAAIRADPRAEYKAALAWALILDPKAPDRARARSLIEEALQDRSCDRAFYVAGVLAREEGNEGRAEAMFRGALEANPQNVEAGREVRLIELRRQKKGGQKPR